MTTFRRYQTKEGDRWDLIAFAEYGDPYGYQPIILANVQYRHLLQLPAGVTLRIPVLASTTAIAREKLPPWKR